MLIKRLFFFPIFILIYSSVAFTIEPSIRFQHITIEDGLPQNSIHTILQDSIGFLWFGTYEGLVRYDGYSLKVFKHEPSNSLSLSHDYISILIEDSQSDFWVGTRGGLNHFNTKTEESTQYRHQISNSNSLSDDEVTSIIEDNQGDIWVGTFSGGLNHFNTKTKQFNHYRHQANNMNSLSHDTVLSLLEDSKGNLWIGTREGGLNYFNKKTKDFTHYRHQANNSNSLSHDSIRSIIEDNQGNLWIGTFDGLDHFDTKTKKFTHYRHKSSELNSLSHNYIWSIKEDSKGNLWIGTYGGGLNYFNTKSREFTHYRHKTGNPYSLNNDDVRSILEDNQGNLWIGTFGGGLNYFNSKDEMFTHYFKHTNESSSLSNNYVWSIMEDSQRNLWLGTYGGGLNYFNTKKDEFTHYRHQINNSNSLSSDNVYSVIEDYQSNLWVGTVGGGLNHFNTKKDEFTHYRHQINNSNSLSNDDIWRLLEDSKNNLWVGTRGGGLNYFNIKTKKFTHYRHQSKNPNSLSHDSVWSLLEDSRGNLWIGTIGGGLNHFNVKTKQFTHYRHQAREPKSIGHDSIYSIMEDSEGNLWVGTPDGLNHLNIKTKKFKLYTKKNGLPNNVIYSIEEDNQGYIWLSTNQGLSRMEPKTGKFKNYDVGDGLQSNEFNGGSSFKSESGELFFGGINGFNSFYTDNIIEDIEPPKVLITNMLLLNKSIPIISKTSKKNQKVTSSRNKPGFSLAQAIHETETITLTYKENIVAFEFSALHFSNSKKNQFAYQLMGWDKDWVTTDYKNRRATYTNLPDGSYTFRVKASNSDGFWNEDGASIQITVLPPPWKTWWAYTLYGLFFLSLILAFIHSQKKKVLFERAINKQLEQKVAERTAELEKVSLTDQLTGAHNRRFLDKFIGKEVAQINRVYFENTGDTLPKLGFIMLDMDHFKQVNDVHGHDAGDRVLVKLVQIITETSRQSDWVVRWGGEEFVVIVNAVNLQEVQKLAERIRVNIEVHSFDIGNGKTLKKTCSIGISSYPFVKNFPEALSWEQTLNLADIALYAVKNNGRNAWISVFEKEITTIDQVLEVTNSMYTQIKDSHLSYDTSLSKEVDWS